MRPQVWREWTLPAGQGEDPDYSWVVTVIMFHVKLLLGIIGLALTGTWLAHIISYVLVYPPLSPFLNQLFIKLDSAFPLFGTVAFALYCFYLIGQYLSPPHPVLGNHPL